MFVKSHFAMSTLCPVFHDPCIIKIEILIKYGTVTNIHLYQSVQTQMSEPKYKYTIRDKTITVPYNFDEELDLFSNTETKTINELIFEENFNRKQWSRFNQPIVLTRGLSRLTFGYRFNQPIVLSRGLTIITFGCNFNQPIVLPRYMTVLIFCSDFNHPIVLTKKIVHLELGGRFNQPVVLSKKIMYLVFGQYFNQSIDLTKKIVHLEFGLRFDQPVVLSKKIVRLTLGIYFDQPVVLTPNIKVLTFSSVNHNIIDNLTSNIKHLEINGYRFNLPLNNIPCSVSTVMIENDDYEHMRTIPQKLLIM